MTGERINTLRLGQAAEWLLWTHLTLASPLHVFLPLRDMGIDGLVRVPGTDIATAIQVKCRQPFTDERLHLLVSDNELRDPRAVIVAVILDPRTRRLGELALCVDVPTYARLAVRDRDIIHGLEVTIPFPPGRRSHWYPHVVPLDELAGRICPLPVAETFPLAVESVRPPATKHLDVGYRAESRLMTLLAEDNRLNTFKSFPDLEMVEYCVRHVTTGGVVGIQVKAISVDVAHPRGTVNVPRHTRVATPGTYVVVLAEHRESGALHEQCLLIPSMDLGDLLTPWQGHDIFRWDPGSSREGTAVAPYRCLTSELPHRIAALLE